MREPKLINKQDKKRCESCHFCHNEDYAQLQVHRIVFGEDGGRYTEHNSLVVCANDHAKIHAGQIVIDRKYLSTHGWVLHCWIDGKEMWTKCQ